MRRRFSTSLEANRNWIEGLPLIRAACSFCVGRFLFLFALGSAFEPGFDRA